MLLRLGELRLLIAGLIVEYDLGPGVTLYHRSPREMEPGEVIEPNLNEKGEHWLSRYADERQMEQLRQRDYPDRPSRLSAVYMTLVPASRFSTKGFLYAVRPEGRTFITDSRLIDRIKDRHQRDQSDMHDDPPIDHYWAERYWEGVEPNRDDLKFLEVLADSARVIERIDEPNRIITNRRIPLPLAITGEIGMDVAYDDWSAELEAMKDDGIRVLSHREPLKPRDGSKDRRTWLTARVELPKGYPVTLHGGLSERGDDPTFILFDDRKRKVFVYGEQAQALIRAYRTRS